MRILALLNFYQLIIIVTLLLINTHEIFNTFSLIFHVNYQILINIIMFIKNKKSIGLSFKSFLLFHFL